MPRLRRTRASVVALLLAACGGPSTATERPRQRVDDQSVAAPPAPVVEVRDDGSVWRTDGDETTQLREADALLWQAAIAEGGLAVAILSDGTVIRRELEAWQPVDLGVHIAYGVGARGADIVLATSEGPRLLGAEGAPRPTESSGDAATRPARALPVAPATRRRPVYDGSFDDLYCVPIDLGSSPRRRSPTGCADSRQLVRWVSGTRAELSLSRQGERQLDVSVRWSGEDVNGPYTAESGEPLRLERPLGELREVFGPGCPEDETAMGYSLAYGVLAATRSGVLVALSSSRHETSAHVPGVSEPTATFWLAAGQGAVDLSFATHRARSHPVLGHGSVELRMPGGPNTVALQVAVGGADSNRVAWADPAGNTLLLQSRHVGGDAEDARSERPATILWRFARIAAGGQPSIMVHGLLPGGMHPRFGSAELDGVHGVMGQMGDGLVFMPVGPGPNLPIDRFSEPIQLGELCSSDTPDRFLRIPWRTSGPNMLTLEIVGTEGCVRDVRVRVPDEPGRELVLTRRGRVLEGTTEMGGTSHRMVCGFDSRLVRRRASSRSGP